MGEGEQATRAAVRAEHLEATPEGQSFTLVLPNGRVAVRTAILGRYNVSNLLAVAAVLYDTGLAASDIAARLQALAPPPGRLERLGGEGEPLLVVDYAHTPDAPPTPCKPCATWLRPEAESWRSSSAVAVTGTAASVP